MSTPIFFTLNNKSYPIKITYWEAINVIPDKFDIHLTKIFVDETSADTLINNLIFQDSLCLDLMWYFLDKSQKFDGQYDDMLKLIEDGKDLDDFREALWSAIANFSGPLKANFFQKYWKLVKERIKKADLEKLTSDSSASDSNPGEST